MKHLTTLTLPLLAGLWAGPASASNAPPANTDLTTCVQALANARQAAATRQAGLQRELAACRDRQAEQEETLSGLVKQNEGCEAGKERLNEKLTQMGMDLTQARVATKACQSLYEQQGEALKELKAHSGEHIAQLERKLKDAQVRVERCQTARDQSARQLSALKQRDAERIAQLEAELRDTEAQGKQDRQEANRCQVEREGLQRTLAARNAELTAAQEAITKLRTERGRLQQTLSDTRQGMHSCQQEKGHIAALLERSRQEMQETRARLAEAEAENRRLAQQLSSLRKTREHCQALYDGLEAKMTQVQQAAEACQTRMAQSELDLERLRDHLPQSEGGRLTVEDLKAAATQAAAAFIQAFKAKHQHAATPGADAAYTKARTDLADIQFQIARAEGRSGVYRVQPRDTLASIAHRYYGRGNAWQRLYDANRHVLKDPNRLIPGITLVIP